MGNIDVVRLAAALVVTISVGWLLVIGKAVLVPVLLGVIVIYILETSARALTLVPLLGRLPRGGRRILALILMLVFVTYLSAFVVGSLQAVAAVLPTYADSLEALLEQGAAWVGMEATPDWPAIENAIRQRTDLTAMSLNAIGVFSKVGITSLMAGIYAIFILADLDRLPERTRQAFADRSAADQTLQIVRHLNEKIGGYFAAKTLVNLILALISYAVMNVIGVEFAMFWAILIGVLNYVPYFGSFLGVLFPVTLILVQSGDYGEALVALGALMATQIYVAYYLEPKLIGRSMNLSPAIVLLSLATWSSLWGLVGIVLGAPLTAVLMLILAEIPATRPIAILMSETGKFDREDVPASDDEDTQQG